MKMDGVDSVDSSSATIRGVSSKDVWKYENAFYWFSQSDRLGKMLAQYELYKEILSVPGDVFELGVFKAASLIRLATFRNLLEGDYSRRIVGFDAFGKFPTENLSSQEDRSFISDFESECGEGLSISEVESILDKKGFKNVHLREGNVFFTLEKYLEQNPATRISYLHLDMDVNEPTAYALNLLYDRVVPNGLIVFDDYGSSTASGETDAVDAFIATKKLTLVKAKYCSVPSYVRKPL